VLRKDLWFIFSGFMQFPVAFKKASPLKSTRIFKIASSLAVRIYYCQIKVNEVAVICRIAIGIAYAMGVATHCTRGFVVKNVLFMPFKTFISQYAVPAMTFIAQGVAIGALLCIIGGGIVSLEDILKAGAMGAFRPVGIIGIMTVCTGNNAIRCIGWQKGWYVRVHPC